MMLLILGLFNWLTEYGSSQMTIHRYLAAKSMREARKALGVTLCSSLPIWAFYMFVGTALYVFFYHFPTPESAEILDGTRKAEQILPFFICPAALSA
jgi:SSS family solute:Na+ symporter